MCQNGSREKNLYRRLLKMDTKIGPAKTPKNRFRNLSKGTAHENRAKISSGVSLARLWKALGSSQALLGRLLGGSWLLLAGSWAFLGASWAPLGRLLVALGCLLVPKTGSGSILTGSEGGQGDFGRSLGPTFRAFFVHAK